MVKGRVIGVPSLWMTLLRQRQGERLDTWPGLVKASHIHELQPHAFDDERMAVVVGKGML